MTVGAFYKQAISVKKQNPEHFPIIEAYVNWNDFEPLVGNIKKEVQGDFVMCVSANGNIGVLFPYFDITVLWSKEVKRGDIAFVTKKQ
jgi:hypothetical protein